MGASSMPFHEPTVTLSTLAAFDVLNDMFSDNEYGGKGAGVRSSGVALSDKAGGAVVAQPQTAKRTQQASVRQEAPGSSAAYCPEPTVTINTRDAFEALNDMFSDGLPHEHRREKKRKVRARGGRESLRRVSGICSLLESNLIITYL